MIHLTFFYAIIGVVTLLISAIKHETRKERRQRLLFVFGTGTVFYIVTYQLL